MPSDREYRQGGIADEDGNFPRTEGIDARVLRLVCMERNHWPGGHGRQEGSRLYTLVMDSPENRNEITPILLEALAPMIDAGEIGDIEIIVDDLDVGQTKGVGFQLTYTDLTTGDSKKHLLPAPWES